VPSAECSARTRKQLHEKQDTTEAQLTARKHALTVVHLDRAQIRAGTQLRHGSKGEGGQSEAEKGRNSCADKTEQKQQSSTGAEQ
jgi:hypothetical protein